MDRFHGSFDEWLAQYKDQPHEGGGYLIPSAFSVYADGFMARIYRMIGNKRGWQTIDLTETIRKQMSNG